MTGRRASRRDLFRLLGRSAAGLAGEGAPFPSPPEPPPLLVEAPLERGRVVLDLALHPVPPGGCLRIAAAGSPEPVLLVRVSPDHFAAVSGDCPHCGGALRFDAERDAALCPRGRTAFRMDGTEAGGSPDLRLRSYPCHRAGPRVEVEVIVT